MPAKKFTIYDTDAAHDDWVAAILLLLNPHHKMVGITVCGTGEAHPIQGATNMAALCNALGYFDIPIAYGREEPLYGKPFPDTLRNMVDKLPHTLGLPTPIPHNITNNAVALMHAILTSSKEKISILATGPLTNIAELILQYPETINQIAEVIIMGGAIRVNGNVAIIEDGKKRVTASEWNFYADSKAAHIVFASQIPITLVPLDITNQAPFTKDFYDRLAQENIFEAKMIYKAMQDLQQTFGPDVYYKDFFLWDGFAAWYYLDQAIAECEKLPISVDPETGQTFIDEESKTATLITVATKIKDPNILHRFLDLILLYAKQRNAPQNRLFDPQREISDTVRA